MARLARTSDSSDIVSSRRSSSPRSDSQRSQDTPLSPVDESGSDKENSTATSAQRGTKRNSGSMARLNEADVGPNENSKRRKLSAQTPSQPTRTSHRRDVEQSTNKKYYDPDQNPEERRAVKKSLRNLHSRLNDSRVEYLQSTSRGLVDTLDEADELFENVKQTADATIDSRLLVAAADLSYAKIKNLTLGDSSVGMDIDDFITKCIAFMRRGDDVEPQAQMTSTAPRSSQSQRRRNQEVDDDDEEDGEDGNAMNWQYLGKNACFLHNSRPCLSGFLLGPLSVQKKVRQQTQRRAREARGDAAEAVRPQALDEQDLEKQESASLTVICSEIARLLQRVQSEGMRHIEDFYDRADPKPTDKQLEAECRKQNLSDDGRVPLFHFCVDPESFGQTVENMFYVSFLIKEGKVGLSFDKNGLPTLGWEAQKTLAERQETSRNQAIFTLDFDVWEELIKSYGISKSIIPHRMYEDYDDGTLLAQARALRAQSEVSDMYS